MLCYGPAISDRLSALPISTPTRRIRSSCARRERPRGRRAAECGQQFPPSDGDCHTPLPREVRKGKDTTPRACSLHVQGGRMLVASTSVAMVAPASPPACRHPQISSRRASVTIASYRVASKATQRGRAMNNDAASFIGNIPEHYDSGLGPMIFVDYAIDIARRAAACSPARVLETASGTGIVTRQLRNFLPPGVHLTATDLNAPMLEVARTKFRPGEEVAFQPADAAALPFSDGTFDAVVCQFGVMFFPQKDTSYREVHRVLAPGGRYLFSVWDSHRHNPFGRIAHETAASFFPADPPQFYMVPFSYYQIDPIKESLIDAGFTDIRVAVVRLEKEIPDTARFARGLVHGNPLIDQIKARGGVDPDRIVNALAQALRQEFGSDPGRMPLQAIVFSANRR